VYEAGRLDLLAGKRKITEGLRLGFFTQDLAQELDASKVALDIGADAHVCSRMLTYAHVCSRMLELDASKVALDMGADAHVCSRLLTYAHVCSRMLTYARVFSRMLDIY
jgi:hypothetical protein